MEYALQAPRSLPGAVCPGRGCERQSLICPLLWRGFSHSGGPSVLTTSCSSGLISTRPSIEGASVTSWGHSFSWCRSLDSWERGRNVTIAHSSGEELAVSCFEFQGSVTDLPARQQMEKNAHPAAASPHTWAGWGTLSSKGTASSWVIFATVQNNWCCTSSSEGLSLHFGDCSLGQKPTQV